MGMLWMWLLVIRKVLVMWLIGILDKVEVSVLNSLVLLVLLLV